MTDLQALVASMRYVFPIRVSESHPHQELGNWCKSKDLVASGGLSADSRTLSSGKNMWSSKCLFMLSRLLSTTFFVGGALDEQGLRVEGLVELSHRQKLGIREEDLVKELVQRVSELIRAEQCMERGMTVEAAFDAVVPRELTPIGADDQEYQAVDAWAHAGDQLGELLKGFVTEASLEEVKVRLGQALLASSLSGSLQMAKASLKAVETPFELLPSVGNLMLPLPEESASPCKPVE
ncbi:Ckb, partial [Symbiodinium pilosum]